MILKYVDPALVSSVNVYTLLMVPVTIFTTIKLSTKGGITTKAQYLFVLIITYGLFIAELNLNFLVPIYILVEMGMILFLVTTTKGLFNMFSQKQINTSGPVIVLTPLAVIIVLATQSSGSKLSQNSFFLDTFRLDPVTNEFISWAIVIAQKGTNTLSVILIFITIATLLIIVNKNYTYLSNYKTNRLVDYSIFSKINKLIFILKKNTLSYFLPK